MVTIRPAVAADAELIGRLMSEAFRDDPTWSVYYPDASTRPRKLHAHYRRRARRHPDLAEVAVDDGRVGGALMWEQPHRASTTAAVLRSTSRIVRRLVSRFPGRKGIAHTLAVEKHRPIEPHWYIHDIATSPQARGKGVGTALLEHRLAAIDAAGRGPAATDNAAGSGRVSTAQPAPPTALESTTPGSRRLYERFGFEAVAQVPTQPGQSSTIMVRRPI